MPNNPKALEQQQNSLDALIYKYIKIIVYGRLSSKEEICGEDEKYISPPNILQDKYFRMFQVCIYQLVYRGNLSLAIWLHFQALEVIEICWYHLQSKSTLLPQSLHGVN